MKKVSIVIPNWNGKEILEACLKSLKNQSFRDFEVIVVDNGSSDGSVQMLRRLFPETITIKLKKNLGFAPAVNKGIIKSKSKFIVLMNNDTEAEKDWLKELVNMLEASPEYSIAASKMLFFKHRSKINTAGDQITRYGWAKQRGFGQDQKKFNKQEPIFAASAGAAIYRRELFDKIGLFDEKFFAYIEDVDLCFRAQLAGYKCVFVPKAKIYHHVSLTTKNISDKGEYLTVRNTLLMVYKNFPTKLLFKYFIPISLSILARIFMDKSIKRIIQNFKALAVFVVLLPYTIKQRRRIKKLTIVSAGYIDSFIVQDKPFNSSLWGKNE